MSHYRMCWVQCDNCGDEAPAEYTMADAVEQARAQGWSQHADGTDHCPDCEKKHAEQVRLSRHADRLARAWVKR